MGAPALAGFSIPHLIASEDHVKSPATMLAVAVLALGSLQASDGDAPVHSLPDVSHSVQTSGPIGPEPPTTTVSVGDQAPDFSFESLDHHWRHLHDLMAQGSVLLVFAPDDDRLRSMERERDAMLQRGILAVAVLDRREGAARSAVNRLHLHFNVIADPRGVIAEQFNLMDNTGPRMLSSWFVVDRSGLVRGMHRDGVPGSDFLSLGTRALGLPADGATLPAVAH